MVKVFSIFCILTAVLTLASCKFNPNLQGRGMDFMQGIWVEEKVAYQDKLLRFTRQELRVSCDSFYVTLNTYAKVNPYSDSCFNSGQWKEYAKGIYTIKKDTLFLSGTFTKSNFKQKISGCYRIGEYLETYVIEKHSSDSLVLHNIKEHLPTLLTLKSRINCVPKPVN